MEKENNKTQKKEKPILTEEEIKKKKARKTRTAVTAFVLILGVGVMGNWYYQNSDLSSNIQPLINTTGVKTLGEAEFVDATTEITEKKESEYFSQARIDRQTARDETIDTIKETLEKSTDKSAKTKAEEKIAEISNYISIENKIETLVTAKGVDNCIAVINSEGTKVDVIVECSELSDNLIMQIKEIAIEQLGCDFKDVSIVQANK